MTWYHFNNCNYYNSLIYKRVPLYEQISATAIKTFNFSGTQLLRGVAILILSLVGVALNLFILTAIIPNNELHTTTHILLSHLAVVASVVCVLVLPMSAVTCIITPSFISAVLCRVHGCLLMLLTTSTTWTLALITWDKYKTISCPLRYNSHHGHSKKLLAKILVIWFAAILVIVIPATCFKSLYRFNHVKMYCTINYVTKEHRWVSLATLLMVFYLPSVVIISCYAKIYRIATSHRKRIFSVMTQVSLNAYVPVTACTSQPNSAVLQRGRKSNWTLFLLIGTFVVSYIPYTVISTLEVVMSSPMQKHAVVVCSTLLQVR